MLYVDFLEIHESVIQEHNTISRVVFRPNFLYPLIRAKGFHTTKIPDLAD